MLDFKIRARPRSGRSVANITAVIASVDNPFTWILNSSSLPSVDPDTAQRQSAQRSVF